VGPFDERKMFGGLCFMYKDRMCCGVLRDHLIVKLAPEQSAEALGNADVRAFDFTGRPMVGMLYVGPRASADDRSLRRWLLASVENAGSLPPKKVKAKRR